MNDIVKLLEATDAFDKYLPQNEIMASREKYPNLKDRNTQIQLINDAKAGDLDAVNVLYDEFKGLTSKAFWKYYLGPDKKFWPSRIRAGEDYDFASRAYELLASPNLKTSPYNTFEAAKFDDKTDLVKKFGYYFFRYLQNEAFKMLRSKNVKGLGGNIPQDAKVEVASYEDVYDNSAEASDASHTEDIDLKLTLDSFTDTLSPKHKGVFDLKRDGHHINDIAEQLGMSHVSVRTHLKDIKDLWDAYV